MSDATSILETAIAGVRGAVNVERTDAGAVLHRVPADGLVQAQDFMLSMVSATPSGVRVELMTDAVWIELVVQATTLVTGTHPVRAVVGVVVDGEEQAAVEITPTTVIRVDLSTLNMAVEPAPPATVRIELGGGTTRRVELWLPNAAQFQLVDVLVPAGSHAEPTPDDRPHWVHYGSSISQCGEADGPLATWPAIVARRAGVSLTNLGLGGQCHLDGFMAHAIAALPADAVSLKVGINIVGGATMRERVFGPALHSFLDVVRAGHPDTPLVVVTAIASPNYEQSPGPGKLDTDGMWYPGVPWPPELRAGVMSLARSREVIAAVVATRQSAGDRHLHLVDGLDVLGVDDVAALADNLHPDTAGYALMAERFERLVFGNGGPFASLWSS